VNKLEIGRINRLKVMRQVVQGLYLESSEGDILLPKGMAGMFSIGDWVQVFIHTDSEDRLVATTEKPRALLGEMAGLRVTDVTRFGAFLDWGLRKDLLCPNSQQQRPLQEGEICVARVCLDEESQRLYATTKLAPYMEIHSGEFKEGEEVSFLALWPSDLGYSILVNGRFKGLVHQNDLSQPFLPGKTYKGWVKQVREDGGLGVAIRAPGFDGILEAKPKILEALKSNGGHLPLGDHSDANEIRDCLHMSKKTFKKAVGGLMKDGLVAQGERGLILTSARTK
jgi:uncharacterized protein